MAPERFRGEGDARADIYALGLTLYELLTLRPAYESADRFKLIERIKGDEPPRPRSRDDRIPRDLETIVLKAIDKDPDRRYASADAMAEDLRRFLADEPIRARQVSSVERYWRWARRNQGIAFLGAAILGVLVLATVGSLIVAGHMAYLAENAQAAAGAERSARQEASRQARAEADARGEADQARAAAQAEAYGAMLSEVKALRAGRQPGWRDEALATLARLAVLPMPRRDLVALRTEATATLRTPDIHLVARLELPSELRGFAFNPDGQTLVTAGDHTGLEFWKRARPQAPLLRPRLDGGQIGNQHGCVHRSFARAGRGDSRPRRRVHGRAWHPHPPRPDHPRNQQTHQTGRRRQRPKDRRELE